MTGRKVVLYIAMSLDGYIATNNDDLNFLSVVQVEGEDYGYENFIQTVDAVIMGRKTYDKVLTFGGEFPHNGRKCYVISSSKSGKDKNVEFYNGNPTQLVKKLQKEDGKNIFIDGGAQVIFELMKSNLIDRYIVSIIPYLLGGGITLFKPGRKEQKIKLSRGLTFPSGLVQLWYEKI